MYSHSQGSNLSKGLFTEQVLTVCLGEVSGYEEFKVCSND